MAAAVNSLRIMLCTEKQGGHSCWRCYHERKAKRWKCPLNKEFVKILVITYINAVSYYS